MFSLRIVTVDHYLAPPVHPLDPQFSKFRGNEVWQVPVLRIFGVTPGGQKTCLHVHNVFPYLCIPYDDADDSARQPVERFSQLLALDLDKLLNAAAGKSNSIHQHVYNIEAFQATPLYGFRNKETTFLRVQFYNPAIIKRAAELLLSGMVLKRIMQPHEAHIPYILQFLVDHNLHGMNMLNVRNFKFRHGVPTSSQASNLRLQVAELWDIKDQPLSAFLDPKIEKQSVCELELDCCGQDILNFKQKDGAMNPGIAAIWQDERERRHDIGEGSITMPPSLDRDHVVRSESELFYLRKLDKHLQEVRAAASHQQLDFAHCSYQEIEDFAAEQDAVDTITSFSEILDSQDMSLVEMLARATANQSMAENPAEDIDSVLSLLPANQVEDDGSVDNEDEVITREMSQVFDSESPIATEQPRGDSSLPLAQGSLHCSQSSWDDDDEAERLPCQLDGTDDDPDLPQSKKCQTESPHFLPPLRTEGVDNVHEHSSPSETLLMTENEKDDDDCRVELGCKFPPLLSRRFLSVPGDDLIGDDSESSCTDSEVNSTVQARPRSSCDLQIDPLNKKLCNVSDEDKPAQKQSRTGRLSLTLRKKARSESLKSENVSKPSTSSGMASDGLCFPSLSDTAGERSVAKSGTPTVLSAPSCEASNDQFCGKQLGNTGTWQQIVRKGSKRTAREANLRTPILQSSRKRRKTDVETPESEAKCLNLEGNPVHMLKECTVVLTRMTEACCKAWTQAKRHKGGQKQSMKADKEESVARTSNRSTQRVNVDREKNLKTKDNGGSKQSKKRNFTQNSSKESSHRSSKKLSTIIFDSESSDLGSDDLPKIKIEMSPVSEASSKHENSSRINLKNANVALSLTGPPEITKVACTKDKAFTGGTSEVKSVRQKQTESHPDELRKRRSREKKHAAVRAALSESSAHKEKNVEKTESSDNTSAVHLGKETNREKKKAKEKGDTAVLKPSEMIRDHRNAKSSKKEQSKCPATTSRSTQEVRTAKREGNKAGNGRLGSDKKRKEVSVVSKNRKTTESASESVPRGKGECSRTVSSDDSDRYKAFTLSGQSSASTCANDACSPSSSVSLDARVWNLEYVPCETSPEAPHIWSAYAGRNRLIETDATKSKASGVEIRNPDCSVPTTEAQSVKQLGSKATRVARKSLTPPRSNNKVRRRREVKNISEKVMLPLESVSSSSTQQCEPNGVLPCPAHPESSESMSSQALLQPSVTVPSSDTDVSVFRTSQTGPDASVLSQDSSRSLFSGSSCITSRCSQGSSKANSQPVVTNIEDEASTTVDMCTPEEVTDIDYFDDDLLELEPEQHWVILDEVADSDMAAKGQSSPDLFASQEQALSGSSASTDAIEAPNKENLITVNVSPMGTSQGDEQCAVEQRSRETADEINQNCTQVVALEKCQEEPTKDVICGVNASNEACSLDFTVTSDADRSLLEDLVNIEGKLNASDVEFDKIDEGLRDMTNESWSEHSVDINTVSLDLVQLQHFCEEVVESENQPEPVSNRPASSTGFDCCVLDAVTSVGGASKHKCRVSFAETRTTGAIQNLANDREVTGAQNTEDASVICIGIKEDCHSSSVKGGNIARDDPKDRPHNLSEPPAAVPCADSAEGMLQQSVTSQNVEIILGTSSGLPNVEIEKAVNSQHVELVLEKKQGVRCSMSKSEHVNMSLLSSESLNSTIQAKETEDTSGIHSFYMNTSVLGESTDTVYYAQSKMHEAGMPSIACKDGLFSVTPLLRPPTFDGVESSLEAYGLPSCVSLEPFCSHPADGPIKSLVNSDNVMEDPLHIFNCRKNGTLRADLPAWQQQIAEEYAEIKGIKVDLVRNPEEKAAFCRNRLLVLTPVVLPPSYNSVEAWVKDKRKAAKIHAKENIAAASDPCGELSQNSESEDMQVKQSTPLSYPRSLKCGSWEDKLRNVCRAKKHKVHLQEKDSSSSFSSSSFSWDLSPLTPRGRLTRRVDQDSPPSSKSCERVVAQACLKTSRRSSLNATTSQLEGPTRSALFNFKLSKDSRRPKDAAQMLTVMSTELHVRTRGTLRPDPGHDPVQCIFYCLYDDFPDDAARPTSCPKERVGAIVVGSSNLRPPREKVYQNREDGVPDIEDLLPGVDATNARASGSAQVPHDQRGPDGGVFRNSGVVSIKDIHPVADEKELFQALIGVVRAWDPDILVGYEIQMLSWGYLLQRASRLGIDLHQGLSRAPTAPKPSCVNSSSQEETGAAHVEDVTVTGRVVLNIWRVMRKELTLNIYTFENVYYHVMHQRIPLYKFETLTKWFEHNTNLLRWRVVEHYVSRACGNMKLLNRLDIIGKTSEMARIFGILFFEVLSRGSQFRVESMMLRSARQRGMVALSPSVQQRARMRAPEWIPLVMEPQSQLYTSPVLVLDFQSLYPSIMIAYNYCFSTCIGRVDCLGNDEPFVFGCGSLSIGNALLNVIRKYITVSPAGVAFVLPPVRKGILPQMLEEILTTRIMVKQAMKECKNDMALTRVLDARQLGLKLIANVTYGYTAASFSGRMSCVEVADSIVSKGRETLEKAIKTVEQTTRWGAKVIYGDTDSMFVLLEGKTKRQAFEIGQEIAEVVTAQNPKPVKLKFEKVYLPCILQTKKRYVGFAYESMNQLEPTYDAKGIETVRRDGCPAVSKILEKSLRILFQSRDVSTVRHYVQRQFSKILSGKVNMQDFIFAKEYRGIGGYKPGACVPALEITRQLLLKDPRAEPRVGERVPYVIVYGSPGMRLIQLVRHVHHALSDPAVRINSHYYITRAIAPALNRVFNLLGTDVLKWYSELPRQVESGMTESKGSICHYLVPQVCTACKSPTPKGEMLCSSCRDFPQYPAIVLGNRLRRVQKAFSDIRQICNSCMGFADTDVCISLDCPVLYRFVRAKRDVQESQSWKDLSAVLRTSAKSGTV